MIGPLILCIVVAAVALAIWCMGILPDSHCKLHDWQPQQDGRLLCAKCKRRPGDE